MTEDEKKAIKQIKKDIHLSQGAEGFWFEVFCDSRDIETVLNLITKLKKENKEKDKQIDIMARAFKQDDVRSVEEIKEYFEKQAKEKGD